jgi:uncharacterized membrane protein YeaQ/YmgE (transglycosylase-associated protein family)
MEGRGVAATRRAPSLTASLDASGQPERTEVQNVIWSILFYLVVGTIVGLLGKFFAPGDKDNIPLWLTVVCGIGGMLVGDVIYRAFGGDGSRGLDWTQGIVTVATAVVLVILASSITGRRKTPA